MSSIPASAVPHATTHEEPATTNTEQNGRNLMGSARERAGARLSSAHSALREAPTTVIAAAAAGLVVTIATIATVATMIAPKATKRFSLGR